MNLPTGDTHEALVASLHKFQARKSLQGEPRNDVHESGSSSGNSIRPDNSNVDDNDDTDVITQAVRDFNYVVRESSQYLRTNEYVDTSGQCTLQ